MRKSFFGMRLVLVLTGLSLAAFGCRQVPGPTAASCTNCSAVTPESFVSALVQLAQSGQIAAGYAGTTLVKDPSLKNGWFVIWDGATQQYMAVSLSGSDLTGYCTQNDAVCSNINPDAAAEAFVNGGNQPVYEAQSVTSGSATVSGNLGGQYFYGTISGSSTTAVKVGSYSTGSYGSETVSPQDWINEATGASYGSGVSNAAPGLPGSESGNAYYTQLNIPATGEGITAYTVTPTGQSDSSGTAIYTDTYGEGTLYSQSGDTRDTDLQQANLQQASFLQRAGQLSANFQMDFAKAVQLTTLSDKLTAVKTAGQALTDSDRAAVMQTLQGIAGVSSDELTAAVSAQFQGNAQPANDLIDTISKNLGMPNSATLKNQILPQLGLNLN